ncbi:hypothetical protein [Paenibacillus glycinis]|uniref:Uncharacterized protein n=1 Tax=Paenibacillus glycinis TaxID=2697035 RepID=A0ABW9XX86_9BACL|nr:hypothetical protein [Paenibacillus glycinis]NBD27313.1 hypothetical protein [Paenibacillus glycinis]
MKRMPYVRPTEYYDERVKDIDEQLCWLLRQRKDLADNNPGYPPFAYIAEWAAATGLYEDLLKSLFGLLNNEEHLRPIVVPSGPVKRRLVSRFVEQENSLYAVPFINHYPNASVVRFTIDREEETDDRSDRASRRNFYELHIDETYECRMTIGSSSSGHNVYNYVVSPPLPDDSTGMELQFQAYAEPLRKNPIGPVIDICL